MSFETAKKGVDLLKSLSVEDKTVQISFYGGEPLLAEELVRKTVLYADRILHKESGKKVLFEMTTNGLLLTEDFIKFTKGYHFLIALSHDGISHNLTRCNTLTQAESALDLLLKHFPSTPIMMTIHPDCVENLSASCEYFYSRGVRKIIFTPANGKKSLWTDSKLETLKRELRLTADIYVKYNQGNKSFCIVPFENKIRQYVNNKTDANADCALNSNKILIDSDGTFYPCMHFIGRNEFECGNICSAPNWDKLSKFESERTKQNECSECALKTRCSHSCACANHGFSGSLCNPSDFQCEYEQTLIALADKAAEQLINEQNVTYIKRIYG